MVEGGHCSSKQSVSGIKLGNKSDIKCEKSWEEKELHN